MKTTTIICMGALLPLVALADPPMPAKPMPAKWELLGRYYNGPGNLTTAFVERNSISRQGNIV